MKVDISIVLGSIIVVYIVFFSPFSDYFGLPDIKDNYCEGIVIQPCVPIFLSCGSRAILKNVNDTFKDKSKDRIKPIGYSKDISKEVDEMRLEIIRYCNINRLNNLTSKIGEITRDKIGMALKELNKDTLEDFMKDNKDRFEFLIKSDQKQVTRAMSCANSAIVLKNM